MESENLGSAAAIADDVSMRTYSKRERILFGVITPVPVLGVAVMIVERDTYLDWFFWFAMFGRRIVV